MNLRRCPTLMTANGPSFHRPVTLAQNSEEKI
jgi:hypothetical protein